MKNKLKTTAATSTRKICEAYAKEHSLKLEVDMWRESGEMKYSHKIELPKGLYTTEGLTGMANLNDDGYDGSGAEYWFEVLGEMKTLVADGPWLTLDQAKAKGLSV